MHIFPKHIDNTYTGHPIALYAFYLITAITIIRSLIHIIAPDGGAQSIATIPLDTYSIESANTVIFMFGLWGISQLLLGILFLIIAIRYRALIPLMYIFIFTEYSLRLILGFFKPITLTGVAPGGIGNYVFIILSILLFILSMKTKKT
jgi:hypothetical protein